MSINSEFKQARLAAGLTQEQAADLLYVTQSRISMVERELRPVADEWLSPRAPGLKKNLFRKRVQQGVR